MTKILLVDDEPSILSVLSTLLKAEGFEVTPALGGEKAKECLEAENFDLMLSDIRMAPVNGMELLRQVHEERPAMPVIMLTAYGSVETAIEALKLGAYDYITKPFKVDELLITVRRALEYCKAVTENADLKAQLGARYQLQNLVAESAPMQNVCEMVRKVAPTNAAVLVQGDSGTGKELVAKAIHANSPRKEKRFLAVNCAALPEPLLESEMFGHVKGAFTGASTHKEGLFEAAAGGTVFLDEISSMPLSIQSKFLRVLQEKEMRRVGGNKDIRIDVRIIAATNSNLEERIADGSFREDLFYRLSVIPIVIPPLKERQEDILPLAYHFLRAETPQGQTPLNLDPEVAAIFEAYPWPGNVRELENAIKHAITFAHGEKIAREALPPKLAATQVDSHPGAAAENDNKAKSLKAFLRSKEKEYLNKVLSLTNGDKEKAAESLKISLATLYRKLPKSEDEAESEA